MPEFTKLLIDLGKKISQRNIFIASTLLGFFLLYLAYVFFLSHSFLEVNSKRMKIADLEDNYQNLLKITEVKEIVQQDVLFAKKQAEEATRYIPTEAELTKIVSAIIRYAEMRNIIVLSFNADFTAQEKSFAFEKNGETFVLDKLKVKKVKIQVEGNYKQVIYFLYDLANTERTYVVREVTLESLEKKDYIKADVEILIFFTKEVPDLLPLIQ